MRTIVTLLAVVSLLGPSRAQQSRATSPHGVAEVDANLLDPPMEKGVRFVDNVVAMIGDKALLWSTIKDEVSARVTGRVNAGQKVTDADRFEFAKEALQGFVHSEILAQSARVSGPLTPSELNDRIAAELQLYLDEQVQKWGSFNQYMRALEEQNMTWEDVSREYREDLLRAMTLSSLRARYHTNKNLIVTPRQMRRFYEQNLDRYRSKGGVDVDRIAFQGPDRASHAAAAVTAWRAEPTLDAPSVAGKHGGRALTPLKDPGSLAASLKDFVARAEEGEVSDPISWNEVSWVLRATRKRAAAKREFSDPEVQREIRDALAAQSQDLEHRKLVMRNQGNLWIKTPPWLTR